MAQEKRSANRLDLVALLRAFELCDPRAMLGFYAEDARVRIVNGEVPQSPPFELRGRAEISRYLRAICDQEMTCRVESEVVSSDERITFTQRCEYADGTRVVVETTLELSGEGGIVSQADVVSQETTRTGGQRGGAPGKRKEERAM